MSLSCFGPEHNPEDLQALRRLIARLAPPCGLDLSDKSAVRRFLDGAQAPGGAAEADQELRAMLILLFRLETCSSEDLGFAGLRRLWQEHSETLARYRRPEALPTVLRHGLPGSRPTAGE